jgi:hypothetical protein
MRASSFSYEERQPRDERAGFDRIGHRDDSSYGNHGDRGHYMPQPQYGYDRLEKDSYASQHQRGHVGFPATSYPHPHYPGDMESRPQRSLQAVVTSSFSLENERDDMGRSGMHHRMLAPENRYESREARHDMERQGVDERDERHYHDYERHHHGNAMPPPIDHRQYIQKSFSTGYHSNGGLLKRSYYHHSHQSDCQQLPEQLPADFMPPSGPKRMKANGTAGIEVLVTPRSPQEWYSQGSYEAEQESYARLTQRPSRSFPPPQNWSHQQSPSGNPMSNGGNGHILPSGSSIDEAEYSARAWPPAATSQWTSFATRQQATHRQPAPDAMDHSPRGSFEVQQPYYVGRSGAEDKMQLVVDAAAATGDLRPACGNEEGLFLLALAQDRIALSETLCVVREVSYHLTMFLLLSFDLLSHFPL